MRDHPACPGQEGCTCYRRLSGELAELKTIKATLREALGSDDPEHLRQWMQTRAWRARPGAGFNAQTGENIRRGD